MSADACPLCTEGTMTVQTSRSPGAAIRPAAATAHPVAAPRQAWLIVALLFLFMVINFADKVVIGIAAVPIMDELLLSPREFGLLGSSFYLLFAVSAVVTGFIVNRVETRWALLVMGLVWALTQFRCSGAPALRRSSPRASRLAPARGRLIPGIALGLQMVSERAADLAHRHRRARRRHRHHGGAATAELGHHLLFLALGLRRARHCRPRLDGGVVRARPPRPPDGSRRCRRQGNDDGIGTRTDSRTGQLLLSPAILACWCANFGAYWGLSQALSWQGAFLIKGLGLSQSSIGLLGALPAGASVVVVIAAGWYSQRLLARGVSSRVARGMLGGGCVALGGMALAVMPYVPGIPAKIALTTIGIAVPSVIHVISHTVVSELTPVAQRGALLAIGTAIGTSAGLLAPYIMGSVVETAATPLAGFNTGFMICGVIMLVGGLIGMALIRPERDAQRWTNPSSAVMFRL